jgi:hypothetical protein
MTNDVDFDVIYRSLLWKAQSGIFYHDKMTKSLQWRNRLATLLNLFLSAGAVVSLLDLNLIPIPNITLWISIVLALVNSYVLAFDLNNRTTTHSDLTRDWIDQKRDIEAAALIGDENKRMLQIQECKKKESEIDKKEPPLNSRLGYWAQLKSARALGLENPDMPWFVKLTSLHW